MNSEVIKPNHIKSHNNNNNDNNNITCILCNQSINKIILKHECKFRNK